MTDHTRLIEILAETDSYLSGQIAKLLEAKPTVHVVRRYMEAWSHVSDCINELSFNSRLHEECRPVTYDSIATEQFARLEQRLDEIAKQLKSQGEKG